MAPQRPSILVVDDVAANVEVLGHLLGERYEVLVALSGPEALAIAAQQRPSLILLDVVMPTMDGHQVCRELKANPLTRGIPVIFVTSLDEDADEAAGFALGAIDYVTKPIRPAIVLARIQNHLERERLIAELQKALSDVNALSGLIPICAWCHKLRNDDGYWRQVDAYLTSRGGASITHGICPDCAAQVEKEIE